MKKYGLPKACLLRKNKEFEQVYKTGKRLHGDGFTLIYRSNSIGCNRLGISVHRHIKGAVKRNRIKRIIRESFRLHRDQYPQHADIVMAVKPDHSFNSPGSVSQAISHLAHVGGIITDVNKD